MIGWRTDGHRQDLVRHHDGPNSRRSQRCSIPSGNNKIPLLSFQSGITDLGGFVRTNPRTKEGYLNLATPPSYTFKVRNGANLFYLKGATNGVEFPPSRRKDGKVKQEDTPT